MKDKLVLVSTLASASLVMASTTCVTAVVPALGADLSATQTEVQWIADAYPVVLAALLLPAGALLDLHGRRRGLIAGLVLIVAALIWSGVADSAGSMIASRAVAGIGGALVFPATLATITAVMPEDRRPLAVALWAGSVMGGGGYGLVLGGAMVEVADAAAAFLAIAGVAVACLALAVVAIPETRDPDHANLDPVGSVLSVVGIGALVTGIIEWPVQGISDPVVAGALAVGVIAMMAFIGWELRTDGPLLDVRLFTHRMFGSAALTIFAMFGAAFGWFFLAFQYYAFVLDWGPLQSALGLMPNIIPLVVFAPLGAIVARRLGVRWTMTLALLIMGMGALVTAWAGHTREFGAIAAGFAFIGLGGGLGQGPATQAIVEALPKAKQGVASAVNDAARELGAAVGIAVIGSAFTAGYRHRLDGESVPQVVRDAPATGLAAMGQQPDPSGTVELIRDATVAGWESGMLAAAALLLIAALAVGIRARDPRQRAGDRSGRRWDSTEVAVVGVASHPPLLDLGHDDDTAGCDLRPVGPLQRVDALSEDDTPH